MEAPCIIKSIRQHGFFCIPQPSGNFWHYFNGQSWVKLTGGVRGIWRLPLYPFFHYKFENFPGKKNSCNPLKLCKTGSNIGVSYSWRIYPKSFSACLLFLNPFCVSHIICWWNVPYTGSYGSHTGKFPFELDGPCNENVQCIAQLLSP